MKIKFLISIVVLIFLDQYTKYLVVQNLSLVDIVPVVDNFLNIVLTYNYGIAFGVFSKLNIPNQHIFLSIFVFLALIFIVSSLLKSFKKDFYSQAAISLIISGALGNIIDRVRLGYVVDFIDVYIGSWHWPAFNVADSLIFIAVFILLIKGKNA